MNRRYALPAAIALTFHAVLFLGNGKPPVKHLVIDDPAKAGRDELPMPRPDETVTVIEDEFSTDEIPVPTIERPVGLDEPIVVAGFDPSRFEQKRIVLPPGHNTKLDPIALSGPGTSTNKNGPVTFSPDMLDETPRTRFQKAPVYPPSLKRDMITGTVVVNFLVDENGRVHDVRVVKSANASFDAPTLAAVSEWRFEPGKRKGIPVRFRMSVPVVFKLDGV